MIFLEERKQQHQSVFDVCTNNSEGQKTVLRTIRAVSVMTQTSDGKTRYIIYDENMRVIEPIYRFLRLSIGNRGRSLAPSTIEHRRTSLRLYVVFCEAFGFRDFVIPQMFCNDFIDFLYRERNMSSSAAVYFSDIKLFLKFIGHEKDPIMSYVVSKTFREGADGVMRPVSVEKYTYAPKVNGDKSKVCPPHNTLNDYIKIQKVMNDAGDFTGCIIVILESYLARRRGEVLGLTIEDIVTLTDPNTGKVSHYIIHRNRTSDRDGQSAKNRKHPRRVEQYSDVNYIDEYHLPKNCIKIEENLYKLIENYIYKTHNYMMKRYPERYETSKADIVNPELFKANWGFEENHYLFLNNFGGPMKKGAWDKRLHIYYDKAGIVLNFGKSINHAWRHMTAYILKHELNWTDSKIADFLGHKGTGTVQVYASADYETMGAMYQTVGRFITGKIESLTEDEDK